MNEPRKHRLLTIIGPGLLVAATGVGAGDLATATFAGSKLGTGVLWCVLVGAFLKYILNEGLARWQLATGRTLLEGVVEKIGGVVAWVFLPYLLYWSYCVGLALMSACGVVMHAIVPAFEDAGDAKVVFGILHSLLGVALVLAGGFKLFEKVMSVCIGVMFVTVVVTAVVIWFSAEAAPVRPPLAPWESLTWAVALVGGVGGTLTVLCYGYWIREEGRQGPRQLTTCRIDLAAGYLMTAVFGVAMVVIGSKVTIEGGGATLIVNVATRLDEHVGSVGKWLFLLGAWGAVFSSLLGVWQAVPYLFADFCGLVGRRRALRSEGFARVDTKSLPYRAYLFLIALVPMLGLGFDFSEVQKYYAVVGACFIPLLAVALLILNGRRDWVGELRNRRPTVIVLSVTLGFFGWFLWTKIERLLRG